MKFTLAAIAAFMVTAVSAFPTTNQVEHIEREVFGREAHLVCNSYPCEPDNGGSPYSTDCRAVGCPGSCFPNISANGLKRCSNTS